MIQKPVCYFTAMYGLIVLILGYMGYRIAKSLVSFIMGTSMGLLVLLAAVFMFLDRKWALYLAFILSCVLAIVFGVRFSQSLSFMPGFMVFYTAIGIVFQGRELYRLRA